MFKISAFTFTAGGLGLIPGTCRVAWPKKNLNVKILNNVCYSFPGSASGKESAYQCR